MTDLQTQRPPYVPTGRPVRRFVVAQVVLVALFGALWWSGLVAPRLGLGDRANGSYELASGRATATVTLRNESPAAVEVLGASLGDGRVPVASMRVDGRDVGTHGEQLAGGQSATVVIEFYCRPSPGEERSPARPSVSTRGLLRVTVRTPMGLERTRTAGPVELPCQRRLKIDPPLPVEN